VRILFVSLFIVIADQLSKIFVKGIEIIPLNIKLNGMYPGQRIPVLHNIFNITFVENPGIAFGIDFGGQFKLLITLITLIACLILFIIFYRNKNKKIMLRLSLAFILGGAIGNLIDRLFYGVIYGYAPLFYGKVVDFFDLKILNIYIFNHLMGNYIFNFADLAVTAGVILLFFVYGREQNEEKEVTAPIENYLAENRE